MSLMRNLIIWLLLSLGAFSASMNDTVAQMITKNHIKPEQVSIVIRSAQSGNLLVSHRPDTIRKPASVMKVLTTYSALLELGGSFRWPTKFYYHGSYNKGTIKGDLVIKAYGDPTLSSKDIPHIIARLQKLGIKRITGDIVIDRSFFDVSEKISSGFDSHSFSEYNAMPDAMMFNDHLCTVIVKPQQNQIVAYKSTKDQSYEVVNNIKPTNKSCSGNRSWPRVLINTESTPPRVTLSGTLSLKCGPRYIQKLVTHAYESFYYTLRAEMLRYGISYHGQLRLAKVPAGARALFTHYSKPLLQIIAKTNKKSNNLYARHLLLLLGAKRYGTPATESKGRKAIEEILGRLNLIDKNAVVLDNGSGLSRKSRITARVLAKILQDANKRYGAAWRETLSVAGIDGTIKKRFRHTVAKGRAWMKTGTLKDAKNIAGYVNSKSSGRLYTVVILYNGKEKWKGSSLQNQIITWLAK